MLTAGANWAAEPIRLTMLKVMRLIKPGDLQRHSVTSQRDRDLNGFGSVRCFLLDRLTCSSSSDLLPYAFIASLLTALSPIGESGVRKDLDPSKTGDRPLTGGG